MMCNRLAFVLKCFLRYTKLQRNYLLEFKADARAGSQPETLGVYMKYENLPI